MRIRSSGNSHYQSRRDRFRIIGLIAALGLVLFAMRLAARPETWRRFLQLDDRPPAGTVDDFAERRAEKAPPPDPDDLSPDEFRTVGGSVVDEDSTQSPGEEAPLDRAAIAKALAEVSDDRLGIRRKELPVYHALLAELRDADLASLNRQARADVSYHAVSEDPGAYRGELLLIEGRMKRLLRFDAAPNPYGLDRLYEAWVFTVDSDGNPYRVVCSEVDDGTPEGELKELVPVRLVGRFFKIERYLARHGKTHPAPLVLAKRLEWVRPTPLETNHEALSKWVLGVALGIAAVLALTLWRISVGDRRFYHGHLKRIVAAPREQIAALDGAETADPLALLAELEQRDRAEADRTLPDEGAARGMDNEGNAEPRPLIREEE